MTYPVSTFGRGPGAHPRYRANQDKAKSPSGHYADASECCCYCGKYTGALPSFYAYLTGYGEFTESEGREDCNDDLAMYPVGSECAKVLKKAGVPLYKLGPATTEKPLGEFKRA